ncbi:MULTISPECIES: 16S rRNA pseudouridine(516) synthase RsuA [Salinivibrio]|uniref:16S rRNA pseudouridine(516) synthase RsuA n=1 Tax=Salinivibrio TaxID=51366 RepID=UPI0008480664|nr:MULTISPECIES: 16S rRNA pseudouridine(516) synthase RsuA [Salinivibrio]ODP97138.1 16S rRNA pseudouridine(516) synthase [Salinivibrio sp. BNH]OOE34164.1 16S rRNA pseudouridine(516) synthase [Salinivibrio kushneri]OOE51199.1 16S rRNA pseudouridine(516) synthase [Salinivibrio kushneri]OOE52490.1 16S rRNA pseudouridine(516) synthase [Salinivibrio kushneri]OOE53264.1 16S rRNA pseudouridine(516) synthase [Salinivibrio kushneri]
MRLDKFLCETLGVTRKQAGRVLKSELVTVDGEVIKSGAVKVNEHEEVAFEGRPLTLSGPRYFMMHKPAGVVCSHEDAFNPTVFVLLDEVNAEKLHIAGRLDADTTGLLLLTDDGQWSHRITSPKHQCSKTYRVWLVDPISPETAPAFKEGVMLRGEKQPTLPATLEKVGDYEALLTIQEGKYHQVKRMFAAVGNKVDALHRESIGNLVLDEHLEPGEYRPLTDEEIALLG